MGRPEAISLPAVALPLAEEVPVAFVYNGTTQAVMMASPADLEEFALGFSLTEGIVTGLGEIEELEIVAHGSGNGAGLGAGIGAGPAPEYAARHAPGHAKGIEARMWLAPEAEARLAQRRRAMAGPVGCGLCGIDSIEAALRPAARVEHRALRLEATDLRAAPAALRRRQPLHDATHAAHGAGLWRPGVGLVCVREDVGRHNALDKLAGACLRAGEDGRGSAVVLTSRVSVEMVQKAAAMGAEAILAMSAPTALAVQMAEAAGLTLVAGLKAGGTLFTHPDRVALGALG